MLTFYSRQQCSTVLVLARCKWAAGGKGVQRHVRQWSGLCKATSVLLAMISRQIRPRSETWSQPSALSHRVLVLGIESRKTSRHGARGGGRR